MRKVLVAAGIVVATAGVVSTAHAEPNGRPMEFTCDGEDVVINVAGGSRVGYIGGEKFKAVSITGTLPTGETAFTKVYGGGRDLADPDAVTCTATDPDSFTITVVAVPA